MKSVFSFWGPLVYGLLAVIVSYIVFEPLGWLGVSVVCVVYAFLFWIWAIRTARIFARASVDAGKTVQSENHAVIDQQITADPTKETTDYVKLLDRKNKH